MYAAGRHVLRRVSDSTPTAGAPALPHWTELDAMGARLDVFCTPVRHLHGWPDGDFPGKTLGFLGLRGGSLAVS